MGYTWCFLLLKAECVIHLMLLFYKHWSVKVRISASKVCKMGTLEHSLYLFPINLIQSPQLVLIEPEGGRALKMRWPMVLKGIFIYEIIDRTSSILVIKVLLGLLVDI